MDASDLPRATAACKEVATACGLLVDEAIVLHDSNRLAVRLQPCDVLARVAPKSWADSAEFEIDVAQRLVDVGAPVAALDPRVVPAVHERGDFVVTLWTYHRPLPPPDLDPDEFAGALEGLHGGLRQMDGGWRTPHFLDRVEEAQRLVDDPANRPRFGDTDRELVATTLRTMSRAVTDRDAPEQLLHGEPHRGNLLRTEHGLLFIDLETCCRGPIEFDIAHTYTTGEDGPPLEIAAHYPDADLLLVRDCWILMLAMITAWRYEPGDDLPNGEALATEWLRQLRAAVGG